VEGSAAGPAGECCALDPEPLRPFPLILSLPSPFGVSLLGPPVNTSLSPIRPSASSENRKDLERTFLFPETPPPLMKRIRPQQLFWSFFLEPQSIYHPDALFNHTPPPISSLGRAAFEVFFFSHWVTSRFFPSRLFPFDSLGMLSRPGIMVSFPQQ